MNSPSQTLPSSNSLLREDNELLSDDKEKNKTSIFHNIHKNLITFMKKIQIRKIDLSCQDGGLRAYDLWKIFKECKAYTKKSLYMIFGVA